MFHYSKHVHNLQYLSNPPLSFDAHLPFGSCVIFRQTVIFRFTTMFRITNIFRSKLSFGPNNYLSSSNNNNYLSSGKYLSVTISFHAKRQLPHNPK
ncbi:hypothetical protein HanXRQr2_Chr11g0479131 [Helianthus annuus]|uniref:Uncharacterized protein n=1 Tax=Helianthus annuus TaxID=4232 RepID=A0A9K3HME2_HELAN|nr:hypothetical protein HanXRQr2_Chr11g0479131 [Helianthus annuus]KAJ0874245.1 hypothetical protein HanPSC8_Chr11g0461881 [Helianthus annuus]